MKNSNEQTIDLINRLREEKETKFKGGIYHRTQIDLAYNSNHIEGSKLTEEETRSIFETQTLLADKEKIIKVDDIIETKNHFKCFDYLLDIIFEELSSDIIKKFHFILKSGTSDSELSWFNLGDWKLLPNEVGLNETTSPKEVDDEITKLLKTYNNKKEIFIDDILDFHFHFEKIHPFTDGNGRVGRLILFKECFKNNIVPCIIYDDLKQFYYRGLRTWESESGYLRDTCLTGQDAYREKLKYFSIKTTIDEVKKIKSISQNEKC